MVHAKPPEKPFSEGPILNDLQNGAGIADSHPARAHTERLYLFFPLFSQHVCQVSTRGIKAYPQYPQYPHLPCENHLSFPCRILEPVTRTRRDDAEFHEAIELAQMAIVRL